MKYLLILILSSCVIKAATPLPAIAQDTNGIVRTPYVGKWTNIHTLIATDKLEGKVNVPNTLIHRNISAELDDEVNALRFVASNSDATDDWSALQAAINDAIITNSVSQIDATTFSKKLKLPMGNYRISAPLIIPECIAFAIEGDGGTSHSTTIQWIGTAGTVNTNWMIDARSVLGFSIKNITLIGQSDVNDTNSARIENGIFTRRYSSTNLFNSYNDWANVTTYRFSGKGYQFGNYSGYSAGSYPTDVGQTDNSYFRRLKAIDCRIGIHIKSPNFLQSKFEEVLIFSYGGNPTNGLGVAVEDPNAAPVMFRTKNGIWAEYGQVVGSGYVYAPYEDSDAWSSYSFYVQDGGLQWLNGYAEVWRVAYFDNGFNGTGGTTVKAINSLKNFDCYSGAAGGNFNTSKAPIYYGNSKVILTLDSCDEVYVNEATNSAGVVTIGCRTSQPVLAAINYTNGLYQINPNSYDFGYSYYAPLTEVATHTRIGRSGHMSSVNQSELFIHPNLIPKYDGTNRDYLFLPNGTSNTRSTGLLINKDGLLLYNNTLTPGATVTRSQVTNNAPFWVSADGNVSGKIVSFGTNVPQTILHHTNGQVYIQNYGIPWVFSNSKDAINPMTIQTNGEIVALSSFNPGAFTKIRTGTIGDITNPDIELQNGGIIRVGSVTSGGFLWYSTNNWLFGISNATRMHLYSDYLALRSNVGLVLSNIVSDQVIGINNLNQVVGLGVTTNRIYQLRDLATSSTVETRLATLESGKQPLSPELTLIDTNSPGVNKYYGTDSSGTKAFYSLTNNYLYAALALSTMTDGLTNGTSKAFYRFPVNVTIRRVWANLLTASTTTNVVIDLNLAGSTMMATDKITIETTETWSGDATTQPVLTTTNVNAGQLITADIDTSDTTAVAAQVVMEYYPR